MRKPTHLILAIAATIGLLPDAAAANDIQTAGRLVSTVPTGTPPLGISSTTHVANLNADLIDGIEAAAFQQKLANVVTVALSGGDFTSIQDAIDSITTAAAGNEFVVFVAPGTYVERVTLKPFVSLAGAGQGATLILWFGDDALGVAAATLSMGNASEARDVSIQAGGSTNQVAIGVYFNGAGGSAVLRDVGIFVSNAATSSTNYGVYNSSGFLQILDSTIVVTGSPPTQYGIFNQDASLEFWRSRLETRFAGTLDVAIANASSGGSHIIEVRDSVLLGDDLDVQNNANYGAVLQFSSLEGGGYDDTLGGGAICAFLTDAAGTTYTSTCP